MSEKKIAIIGQGIAGTCVSRQLLQMNVHHHVYDNNHHNASSLVAAGMWNPIVFRKLNKSWLTDDLLPYAVQFYTSMLSELCIDGLSAYNLYRFFPTVEEGNNWMDKIDHPGFESYMFDEENEAINQAPLKNVHGYGVVKGTGRIDLPKLITTYSRHLQTHKILQPAKINYDDIGIDDQHILIGNERYSDIIFCEGYQGKHNPYFSYLPIQCNKGETLLIEAPDLNLPEVVNKGFFILPLGGHKYKVGATFTNAYDTVTPTKTAKEYLIEKLRFLSCDYTILKQESGVRPTVADRKPLIGTHPKYANLHILNGLGSKGASIAPLMSLQLINHILNGALMHEDANIHRYFKRYKKQVTDF